jgi:hypothetical protein
MYIPVLLLASGMALTMTPLTTLIMSAVPLRQGATSADGPPFTVIPAARAAIVLPEDERLVMVSERGEIRSDFARRDTAGEITRLEMVTPSAGWALESRGTYCACRLQLTAGSRSLTAAPRRDFSALRTGEGHGRSYLSRGAPSLVLTAVRRDGPPRASGTAEQPSPEARSPVTQPH